MRCPDFAKRHIVKTNYRIEEILYQTGQRIVYRVTGPDGRFYSLTRLIFGEAELGGLEDGVFEKAFETLKNMSHPCLREVVDGGQDEVDQAPWIVTDLWDYPSVKERHQQGAFTYQDKVILEGQARSLIEALGGFAGTIRFDHSQVIGIKAQDGSTVETFGLDLREWFLVYARTGDAYFDRNPDLGLVRLLSGVPVSAQVVSVSPGPISSLAEGSSSPQAGAPSIVSVSSGFPAGLVVTLISLILLVGGGLWWAFWEGDAGGVTKKIMSATVDSVGELQAEQEEPRMIPKASVPPLALEEKSKEEVLAALSRPADEQIPEIAAHDSAAMKKHVGKWIKLTGHVVRMRRNGGWLFDEETQEGEAISGTLKLGDISDAVEFKITAIGRLSNEREIAVERLEDIIIHHDAATLSKGRVIMLDEEVLIRKMNNEEIRFRGKVLRIHEDARTLALVFTKKKPELAALIYTSKLDGEIESARVRLKQLVGKEITVSGTVEGVSSQKRGLFQITFDQLADLK